MALSFIPRWHGSKTYGVIDIGSNSIRMVIFDELSRSPEQLFNERVVTLLGGELESTGNLSLRGMEQVLASLARFSVIAEQYEVSGLDVVATAAVRDAANGAEFVSEAEEVLDIPVRVVPGNEEGKLSAMGVLSGMPEATGFTGDLGGGSLELARVGGRAIHETASLRLGALRLVELYGEDGPKIRKAVRKAVKDVPFLAQAKGEAFYTVGGLWRNVARLHMEDNGYPLRMLQSYCIPSGEVIALARRVTGEKGSKPPALGTLPRRRVDNIFAAIAALDALVEASGVSHVVVSAFGLREGLVYEKLSEEERVRDPFIAFVSRMADRMARTVLDRSELDPWLGQLFDRPGADKPSGGTGKSEAYWLRLRHAAGILGDFGWRFDTETRARDSATLLLTALLPGIDHIGRAYLALAVWYRYSSRPPEEHVAEAATLLDPDMATHAKQVGTGLRLAFTITGGAPGLLPHCTLTWAGDVLTLRLSGVARHLGSPELSKSMDRLAEALHCKMRLETKA